MDFISDDEYRQMATNSAQNDAKEAIIKNEELEKRIELLERQVQYIGGFIEGTIHPSKIFYDNFPRE